MSRINVGERIVGQTPEIIGHAIVGAGHSTEQTGNIISILASNQIPDFSNPSHLNRWQWDTLKSKYGSKSLIAANTDYQGSAAGKAWKESMEKSFENMLDAAKDTGLAIRSYMAGDLDSAVGYGAAAVEKFVGGVLKDFGFKGGWAGETPSQGLGPTPGQGTCPPGPDRD